MKRAVIHTDGASSGNPGPAGIGAVIEVGNRTREISEHIGTATNNVAEYAALIRGLEEALAMGATEVEARMDSELLSRQLSGEYKVKNPGLKPYFMKAVRLLSSFSHSTVIHVPREENTQADKLAKKASKPSPKKGGKSPSESGSPPPGTDASQGQLFS